MNISELKAEINPNCWFWTYKRGSYNVKSHWDQHQNVEGEELEWTRTFYELSCCKSFLSMILWNNSSYSLRFSLMWETDTKRTRISVFLQKLSNLVQIAVLYNFVQLFAIAKLLAIPKNCSSFYARFSRKRKSDKNERVFFTKSQPLSNCTKSTIAHTKEMHFCKSESVSLWCIQNSD